MRLPVVGSTYWRFVELASTVVLVSVEHEFDFVELLTVGYPVGCRVNLCSS